MTDGSKVKYNVYTKEEQIYFSQPFTIEALDTGTITWNLTENKTIKYSKNGSEYQTWDGTTGIDVVEGDEVAFLGNNQSYFVDATTPAVVCTSNFNVKGNIMSLISESNFWEERVLTAESTFGNFLRQQPVVSAENLLLPATTLLRTCYANLFYGSGLVHPPKTLPALVAADYCYLQMFFNCNNLINTPKILTTVLAQHCFHAMFRNCTSLTSAPELPASTLVDTCYQKMFQNCTNLNHVTCLATNISATNCVDNWLAGVSSIGIFEKESSMNNWTTGSSGIPSGWTVQTASS